MSPNYTKCFEKNLKIILQQSVEKIAGKVSFISFSLAIKVKRSNVVAPKQ